MPELKRLEAEIARLKAKEARESKLSRAKGEIRELKYGKYFRPGRKIAAWGAKKFRKAKKAGYFKTDSGNLGGGGFDMTGGFEFGNPLSDVGNPLGEISMGNPFGEPERRTGTRRHHRKPRVKIIYRSRPRRRRYYHR